MGYHKRASCMLIGMTYRGIEFPTWIIKLLLLYQILIYVHIVIFIRNISICSGIACRSYQTYSWLFYFWCFYCSILHDKRHIFTIRNTFTINLSHIRHQWYVLTFQYILSSIFLPISHPNLKLATYKISVICVAK